MTAERSFRHRLAAESLDELTPREREVLRLMADCYSNPASCEQLFLSPKTVETHMRSIFIKLGLGSAPGTDRRVLAVVAYISRGPDDLSLAA